MSFRITNNMMHDNFMRNYHSSLSRMTKYQYQMSSNKRILRLSDDPIGVMSSMNARVRLYRTEQYQKNVDDAQTWLKQGETSLLDINEIIKEVYADTVDAGTDTKSYSDRQAIAQKVGQFRDHLLQTLNSTYGSKYLFGAYNQTEAPFTVKANASGGNDLYYNGTNLTIIDPALYDKDAQTYNGVSIASGTTHAAGSPEEAAQQLLVMEEGDVFKFEVGFNIHMDVAIPGHSITGTGADNLYNVMDDLYNALMDETSTTDDITKQIKKLQDAQSHVMSTDATVGGRVNRLELLASRYATDYLNYTEIKSNIEDVDLAEASMNFMMAQYVYQSALSVGAKILQPSLVSFL